MNSPKIVDLFKFHRYSDRNFGRLLQFLLGFYLVLRLKNEKFCLCMAHKKMRWISVSFTVLFHWWCLHFVFSFIILILVFLLILISNSHFLLLLFSFNCFNSFSHFVEFSSVFVLNIQNAKYFSQKRWNLFTSKIDSKTKIALVSVSDFLMCSTSSLKSDAGQTSIFDFWSLRSTQGFLQSVFSLFLHDSKTKKLFPCSPKYSQTTFNSLR